MSPPLVGLPGHPPVLWRAGGSRSLAKEMWGADFELWGPDCPLAPGVWRDRIGGLEVECVGSGDWSINAATGAVGVTKSDVCYATFPEAAARKTLGSFFSDLGYRTVCVLAEGITTTAVLPLVYGRATDGFTTQIAPRMTGGYVASYMLRRSGTTGGTFTTYARPRIPSPSDSMVLLAAAVNASNTAYRQSSNNDNPELVAATGTYMTPSVWSLGEMFRRGTDRLTVTNTTARAFRFLSFAACPGIADPAALKAWSEALGVAWP